MNPASGRDRPRGSLPIEVALVAAVAATLLALAAPGLTRTWATHSVQQRASALISALRRARTEAMARLEPVTVCAADLTAPVPRCAAAGGAPADWRGGWLVFVDRGRRGQLDPGDPVLLHEQASRSALPAPGSRGGFTYLSAGFATDAAAHVRIAGAAGVVRLVCVSKQGRARIVEGAACDAAS